MSGDFLDSNVFVYLFDETDDARRTTAERLVATALASKDASISYQVVQETLNVITRKLATPATPGDARRFLDRVLAPLWRVYPSVTLYERALDLKARYGYSFYDSLIVAGALEAGATRLLSQDLQHGQRIEHLTIQDPFRAT
jgi:predicted nucleic acid-binding protein